MPAYCFTTEDGKTVEREFRMGEAPPYVCLEDKAVAYRDFRAEHAPRKSCGGWPFACYASGVHPDQAGELRQYFKDHGCPTEVNKDGDPIYRDANHRKRALKVRGFRDNQAYC